MKCKKCSNHIPPSIIIDGKRFSLTGRKYCVECSPIGSRRFCGTASTGVRNKGQALKRDCKVCRSVFVTKTSQWECRRCQSKRIRNKRKQKAVEILGGKCIRCGYSLCLDALDFHHTDRKTKITEVSTLIDSACYFEEVKKCVLLCCRCHAEYHAGLFEIESSW